MISAHLYLSVSGNRAAIVQAEHKEGEKSFLKILHTIFDVLLKLLLEASDSTAPPLDGSSALHWTS